MGTSKKTTLMQLQVSLPKKIILTVVIMFTLILLVYQFNIPNPNMILIAGLVLCSALFGFGGGIVAAIIMFGYSLFFFSTDHSFFAYTDINAYKLLVIIIGAFLCCAFVGFVKHSRDKAEERLRRFAFFRLDWRRPCRADADAPGSSVPPDARRTRFFVFAAALGALWLYFLFTPPA